MGAALTGEGSVARVAVPEEQARAMGAGGGLVAAAIRGNVFYPLSAVLMIAGAWMLMTAPSVAGEEFARVFRGAMILQGYELAVIATAAFLVRHFRMLGDGLLLILIEVALLLDPTFFTNSLHTLLRSDRPTSLGVYTNVLLFAAAPMKLWIVMRLCGLAPTARLLATFTAGAAFVYMVPLALVFRGDVLVRQDVFVLLGMLMLGVGAAMPLPGGGIARPSAWLRISGAEQQRLGMIGGLMMVALLAHYVEGWWVHQLHFHGAYLSPVLLLVGARVLRRPETSIYGRALLQMVLPAAVLLAHPGFKLRWLEVYNEPSAFLASTLPMMLMAALATAMLLARVTELGQGYVLRFIGVLWTVALVPTLARVGFFDLLVDGLISTGRGVGWAAASVGNALYDHRMVLAVLGWAGMLVLVVWSRFNGAALVAFGWLTLIGVARVQPLPLAQVFPEIFAGFVLMLVIGLEREGQRLDLRVFFSLVALAILVPRTLNDPDLWRVGLLAAVWMALAVVGWMRRNGWYGLLCGAAGLWIGGHLLRGQPPALLLIVGGAGLFAVGIAVSLMKERLLLAVQRRPAPPTVPDPQTTHRP